MSFLAPSSSSSTSNEASQTGVPSESPHNDGNVVQDNKVTEENPYNPRTSKMPIIDTLSDDEHDTQEKSSEANSLAELCLLPTPSDFVRAFESMNFKHISGSWYEWTKGMSDAFRKHFPNEPPYIVDRGVTAELRENSKLFLNAMDAWISSGATEWKRDESAEVPLHRPLILAAELLNEDQGRCYGRVYRPNEVTSAGFPTAAESSVVVVAMCVKNSLRDYELIARELFCVAAGSRFVILGNEGEHAFIWTNEFVYGDSYCNCPDLIESHPSKRRLGDLTSTDFDTEGQRRAEMLLSSPKRILKRIKRFFWRFAR